LTVTTSC